MKQRKERRLQRRAKQQGEEAAHTLLVEMDGVLVDSAAVLYDLHQQLVRKYGREPVKKQYALSKGLPIKEQIDNWLEYYGIRLTNEKFLEEYNLLLAKRYPEEAQLVAETVAFLTSAQEQGFTLALIPSQSKAIVLKYLKSKKIDTLFDAIITAEELPEPNLIEMALSQLGTEPEEAIAIVHSTSLKEAAEESDVPIVWLKNLNSLLTHLK